MKKTRLCRHYMKGFCERGSGCGFAHGSNDLTNSPTCTIKKGKDGLYSMSIFDQSKDISRDYILVNKKEYVDSKARNHQTLAQ